MRPSLHRRLLQMALIPALVFAIVITVYFAIAQNWRAENTFHSQIKALTQAVTPAVVAGLRTGDNSILDQVSRETLNAPHARSVTILRADGSIQMQRGADIEYNEPPELTDALQVHRQGHWVRVLTPVRSSGDSSQPPDAWLQIDYSTNELMLDNYRLSSLGAIVALLGLGLVWLLVLAMITSVTRPFYHILDTVRDVTEGHIDKRIDLPKDGDLRTLGKGINRLGDQLQSSQQEMQHSVDQATQDLRETLETLEIQNIQLSNARRQALEANETKTQFLANMSHEIRTPLNGVIGFIKLLHKTELSQKQRDYVSTIRQSSESLLSIINDILDFLKLDAGKLELERRSMNLRDVVDDVLDMLAPMAQEKSLELVAMVYDDVPVNLIGDPLRLRQILINLINNAIKFTNDGHVVVRVACEGQHKSRVRIRLAVTDTGPGIPRDKQKVLFKAFSQADASTSRRFGGTGLGLVICQRLVHRMGGKIKVESVEGEGSTFALILDYDLDQSHLEDPEPDTLSGIRVFLWEPNEMSRLSLTHRLERWGMSVHLMSLEKSTALDHSDHNDTLAILTYQPENETWLQQVADQCRAADIPVLLLARHNDHSDSLRALENDATAVSIKPIRYQRLFSLCQQLLITDTESHTLTPPRLPKVLVVDDNSTNRKLLVTFLGDYGIQPDEAEDGSEAMERVSKHDYDLVFMDIQMPVMDGVTATREIRRHESTDEHLPIIAITAHALPQEREELMRSGFDDYLTKPISERQLLETIQRWTHSDLQDHSTERAQTQRKPALPPPDSPVDFRLGLNRAGGKATLARDMYQGLLDQLREAQWQLAALMSDQDQTQLLDRVHALHGVTRYCGTPDLEQALRTVENHLKQGESDQVPSAMAELQVEIDRVITWSDSENWDQWLEEASSPALKNH